MNEHKKTNEEKIILIITLILAIALTIAVILEPQISYTQIEVEENEEVEQDKEIKQDEQITTDGYYTVRYKELKSTNGEPYPKKNWVNYEETTNTMIKGNCPNNNYDYTFRLDSSILTITNQIDNSTYTFTKFTNIKNIMTYYENSTNNCNNIYLIFLTTDGKIYYYKVVNGIINFEVIENEIILLNTNYLFEKIGYTTYEENQLGALLTTQEEVTIYLENNTTSEPYDSNLYICLGNCNDPKTLKINRNKTICLEKDQCLGGEKPIYAAYTFKTKTGVYIIDYNGLVYYYNNNYNELTIDPKGKVSEIRFKEKEPSYTQIVCENKAVMSFSTTKVTGFENEKLSDEIRKIISSLD